ncbi:uncharacterized protein [Triticum aestivum]|uniref:uncharacterized protein isoform X1 n=1 Tax=Triticum aestivum TaxID=4565 RepID=UPI001D00F7C2|nr:uncharacterized protein LOC123113368 isoform X1 [Triticum aestivum]
MKEATASGGGAAAGPNDPRQPGTARPYAPPKLSSQDLPVDYAGFLAVVFGVVGVMLHVRSSQPGSLGHALLALAPPIRLRPRLRPSLRPSIFDLSSSWSSSASCSTTRFARGSPSSSARSRWRT